jgi:hypothetical protein
MSASPISVDAIAQVVHSAVRALQIAQGETPVAEWATAEDWQKTSSREAVGFQIANPHAPASAEHDRWMAERIADGWVYGPVKDAGAKTHPLLIPYAQLPEAQRRKDALIKAIVAALAGPSI